MQKIQSPIFKSSIEMEKAFKDRRAVRMVGQRGQPYALLIQFGWHGNRTIILLEERDGNWFQSANCDEIDTEVFRSRPLKFLF